MTYIHTYIHTLFIPEANYTIIQIKKQEEKVLLEKGSLDAVIQSVNYSHSLAYVYLVLVVTQQSDFQYCLAEDYQLCSLWAFLLHLTMLRNAMLGQVEEGKAANPGREKIFTCEEWILLILLRERCLVFSLTLLSVGQSISLLISQSVSQSDSQSAICLDQYFIQSAYIIISLLKSWHSILSDCSVGELRW